MLSGWLKRSGKGNEKVAAPSSQSSLGDEERTITGKRPVNAEDAPVKMEGAYQASQEALRRGACGFLFVYEGPAKGMVYFLGRAAVTIGRHSRDCQFALTDPLVSRMQCKVEPIRNSFRVVDSGSKNGTLVNDQPVTEHELVNGDQISVGASRVFVGIL
jgi:Inner membrane component of T3SS, cytoplasmic domain